MKEKLIKHIMNMTEEKIIKGLAGGCPDDFGLNFGGCMEVGCEMCWKGAISKIEDRNL